MSMKKLVLLLLYAYQKTLPIRKSITMTLFGTEKTCRFTPTCSEYTIQKVKEYGAIKGLLLGFKRILKCHPWHKEK